MPEDPPPQTAVHERSAPASPPEVSGFAGRLLGRLSRVTSSGDFIPEIDGMRFLAIALVIVFHINAYYLLKRPIPPDHSYRESLLHSLLGHGYLGVPIFFAISGFILSLPFASHYLFQKPLPSLKRYYLRRVTRLEPPYLINLFLLFLLQLIVLDLTFRMLLPHLLASVFYVHNIAYGYESKINAVAWSLEVEVQFYLLAPFIARLFAFKNPLLRRASFVGLALLGMGAADALKAVGANPVFSEDYFILDNLKYFMAGFLVADLYLTTWAREPVRHWAWNVVAPAALLILLLLPHQRDYGYEIVMAPVTIFVLLVSAFKSPFWNRALRKPWIVAIGGMCYTIYLYHFAFISLFGRVFLRLMKMPSDPLNVLILVALLFSLVLIFCMMLFPWLEKPFMYRDWPQRFQAWLRRPSSLKE